MLIYEQTNYHIITRLSPPQMTDNETLNTPKTRC